MANKIFINYRRSDTAAEAQNLHLVLSKEFGSSSVFLDVHDIRAGSNWEAELLRSGAEAKIVLILIGDHWLSVDDDGNKRLFHEEDWVRKEIELSIEHELVAIPVLFNNIEMPAADDLPESIREICAKNAISLRHDSFPDDMTRLIREMRPYVNSKVVQFYKRHKMTLAVVALLFCLCISWLIYYLKTKNSSPRDAYFETGEIDRLCPGFDEDYDINTLIMPLDAVDEQITIFVDSVFQKRCVGRFENQSQVYQGVENTQISGARQRIAANCAADVFIKPMSSNKDNLKLSLGFANPLLRRYRVDSNFRFVVLQDSIDYGVGQSSFEASIDLAVCLISGYLNQYRELSTTVARELLKCDYDNTDPRTKAFAFNLMSDSYYEQGNIDSAILCLQYPGDIRWQHEFRLRKIAFLAESSAHPEIAIDAYSELIYGESGPRNVYLERRADQYAKIKDYRRSLDDYNRILQAHPTDDRVLDKKRDVEVEVEENNTFIHSSTGISNTPDDIVDLAERNIENGDLTAADALLSRVPANSTAAKKAHALQLELNVKNGVDLDIQDVSPQLLKENPRLNSALRVKRVGKGQ